MARTDKILAGIVDPTSVKKLNRISVSVTILRIPVGTPPIQHNLTSPAGKALFQPCGEIYVPPLVPPMRAIHAARGIGPPGCWSSGARSPLTVVLAFLDDDILEGNGQFALKAVGFPLVANSAVQRGRAPAFSSTYPCPPKAFYIEFNLLRAFQIEEMFACKRLAKFWLNLQQLRDRNFDLRIVARMT